MRPTIFLMVCLPSALLRADALTGTGAQTATADEAIHGEGQAPLAGPDIFEQVPLLENGFGGLLIAARLGSQREQFLLDTGASMVTVNRRLHRQLVAEGVSTHVRDVAGRLADGRMRTMAVHRVDRLQLGERCSLHDIEVLVLPGEGRNLMGLNALSRFAPLTLRLQPLALELSQCADSLRVVGAPVPHRADSGY